MRYALCRNAQLATRTPQLVTRNAQPATLEFVPQEKGMGRFYFTGQIGIPVG